MNDSILKTDRLLIQPLTGNDSDFILELVNTDGWLKFIGDKKIHSAKDALAYIEKINNNPDLSYFVVKIKNSNISIGLITIIKRDYLPHHDIGFAFLQDYYHKGYAFEASKAVLDATIISNKHKEILAITLHENTSSIKLLEKLGLSFKESKNFNNETLQVYSIIIS